MFVREKGMAVVMLFSMDNLKKKHKTQLYIPFKPPF